ncbi:hypothetical protein HUJ05_010273 [Dendroctonus ponderosae]|nr:hypothetical protein HUJ05_010273 [Dendroctonus ponderosae]
MEQLEEINDENDCDLDSSKGYYTRAKRRKMSEDCQYNEDNSTHGLYRIPEVGKRKNPIMFVPTEVLLNVFKFIPYHELSSVVRLVNKRFKAVAEDMLNLGFRRTQKQLDNLITTTDISLGYTPDDMEVKAISKLMCQLEIINLQNSIITSTIWRYMSNKFYKTCQTCMYGGKLIDVQELFIRKFLHVPNELFAPAVVKDYALPPEVTTIIQLTKDFCIHFDKCNEEAIPNSCTLSGCKMLDILDCARFAQKRVHFERRTTDSFLAKYSYYFKNSWFIAIPIPTRKEMEEPQQQRMMHMRLRRIVLAHNDMYLQQEQYERELILRPNASLTIKKPGNNVYTGYGDVEDTFFYYGVMNDGAYLNKFHSDEGRNELDEEVDELPIEADLDVVRLNSDEDVLYRLPYLGNNHFISGLKIDVSVRCPLSYAPLKFLQSLSYEDQDQLQKKSCVKGETQIHMGFECFGAQYARLSPRFNYETNQRWDLRVATKKIKHQVGPYFATLFCRTKERVLVRHGSLGFHNKDDRTEYDTDFQAMSHSCSFKILTLECGMDENC